MAKHVSTSSAKDKLEHLIPAVTAVVFLTICAVAIVVTITNWSWQ